MRHIEIPGYGRPPCGGEVRLVPRRPGAGAAEEAARRRALPILGAPARPPPDDVWECAGCGKRWPREPRPEEAL